MHPASCLQSTIFLAAGTMRVTCARGSKHACNGNQFMGMVELPKDAIVELELSIDKNPTNMQTKELIEAELVEQIDKYSTHTICRNFSPYKYKEAV